MIRWVGVWMVFLGVWILWEHSFSSLCPPLFNVGVGVFITGHLVGMGSPCHLSWLALSDRAPACLCFPLSIQTSSCRSLSYCWIYVVRQVHSALFLLLPGLYKTALCSPVSVFSGPRDFVIFSVSLSLLCSKPCKPPNSMQQRTSYPG